MHPLAAELEVLERIAEADDSGGLAIAEGVAAFPDPGVIVTIHVDEIFSLEHLPTAGLSVAGRAIILFRNDGQFEGVKIFGDVTDALIAEAHLGSAGHP